MKNFNLILFCIFFLFLSSCQKEQVKSELSTEKEEASILRTSNINENQLEKINPSREVKIEINKGLSAFWGDDFYMDIYDELGFILIEEAAFTQVNEDSYFATIPVVKNDVVNGVIFFYKEMNEISFKLYTSEIFNMPFKNIELALDRAFSLAILSSFSNHQYFINGEISSYQEFLKNYLEYLNDGRNFVFIEICDLITVGSNETVFHSYIDCYTIVEFVSGTGPGVGNSNNSDHTDPHSTYPPDENIPRSGGNSDETSSGSIGGPNYEPSELCKEQINGQLLSFINNQLNFVLPCDEESPMEVRDQIMDDLCQSNPFITISDFLARLDNYNWVNLNGSAEEIQLMVENLPSECKSIFPLSCESFNFEDIGLFQISRLIGESLTLIILDPMDPRNREILDCPYKIQLNAPFSAVIFGVNYEVSSGMAANAAANALNSAAQETLSEYGRNLECEEAINTLINKLNTYFVQELGDVVAESYGLNPNISYVDFEITPEANLEFDNIFNVNPTNRVSDISILTFFKDDCR